MNNTYSITQDVENSLKEDENTQVTLKNFLDNINLLNNIEDVENVDNLLKIIGSLFDLSDEDFKIIAPIFEESILKQFSSNEMKAQILTALISTNSKIEDIVSVFQAIPDEIKDEIPDLSQDKMNFINNIIYGICNILTSIDNVPARTIYIPIEIINKDIKTPTYANEGDAALDLYCPEEVVIQPGEVKLIKLGFKLQVPNGYAMLIQPRSGLSLNTKLRISNSPGLCDSGYRGEYGVIVENTAKNIEDITYEYENDNIKITSVLHGSPIVIGKGERFAQMRLVEVPHAVLRRVDKINETNRSLGFGNSGKF